MILRSLFIDTRRLSTYSLGSYHTMVTHPYKLTSTDSRNITSLAKPNIKPNEKNRIIINFWSPGYTIDEEFKDTDGQKLVRKVFIATSTYKMALTFIEKEYGKNVLHFKYGAHPGHVSIQTLSHYLSLGTDAPLGRISYNTNHNLIITNSYKNEVRGFQRLPEERIALFSLDIKQVDANIEELKKLEGEEAYSLFGSHFKNDSKLPRYSCATSCAYILMKGKFENLVGGSRKLFINNLIQTPAGIINHIRVAKANEHNFFPEVKDFYEKFESETKKSDKELMKLVESDIIQEARDRLEEAKRLEQQAKEDKSLNTSLSDDNRPKFKP